MRMVPGCYKSFQYSLWACNVLALLSNSRLAPGNVEVDRGLRAGLAAMPQAHLFYEFLDSPEFGGETHERTVIAYFRDKYASRPPEILVALSDAGRAQRSDPR